jgi:beta-1,4-mannosyltransferase
MTDTDDSVTVHFLPDYTPTNPYQDRLAEALRRRGVTVRVTDGGGGGLPILRAMWGRDLPDVAHVHFLHQFMTSSATRFPRIVAFLLSVRTLVECAVLRLLGVSLVWTAHDLVNHEERSMRIETWSKHVLLRFLTDHVIVHCAAATDIVVEFYGLPDHVRERMTVVPHGTFADDYPDEVSRATARDRLDLPREEFVFTFFGSIRRYKNVPGLVEAFADLDADATLLIAGNPRTDAIERAVTRAAASVEGVRTVFEFVPSDDVQLYLNAADVVVLPFRDDGASMLTSGSVLLAMSFGRAVIAPDIGCIGEYVGDRGGYVYDPAADAPLRRAMRESLSADRDAMGRHNRERAAKLNWDHVAAQTHAVYTDSIDADETQGQSRPATGQSSGLGLNQGTEHQR